MVVPVIMPMMVVVIVVMMMMMPIIVMVVVPMVMIVIMVVMMIMVMVMVVMAVVVMSVTLQTAQTGTEGIAQRTVRNVRPRRARPLAFDVVMMTFLHGTHFGLKADHFGAIFAQYASRRRDFAVGRVAARLKCRATLFWRNLVRFAVLNRQNLRTERADTAVRNRNTARLFFDTFCKGFENLWVIIQIARFDELDICVFSGNLIGKAVNTVDQNACEQEVREHNDALVAKL